MARPDLPVTLAAVSGAHGVTGEVRLKLFGEGVAALKRYRAFNDSTLTLEKLRDDGKGGAIARFAEIADRNAAEALRGTTLTVPRSAMPELADGEFYHADLIGLPCENEDGEHLGTCIAVENFGAGDLIEIEQAPLPDAAPGARPRRTLVPMTPAAVPEWNEVRILVNPAFLAD